MTPSTRRLGLGAALALGLALPATASAATPSLYSRTSPAGRYAVSVTGAKFAGANVQVTFSRFKAGSAQEHTISGPGRYSAKANLSSARIDARFGPHGRLSMRFRATGGAHRAPVPPGCTGRPSISRTGVLTGVLSARINRRIKATKHSLQATLYKIGRLDCRPVRGGPGLTANVLGRAGLFVGFSKGGGKTHVSAFYSETSAAHAWLISHFISGAGKPGAFTIRGTSATGKGVGPFLGGVLNFTPSGPAIGRSVFGTVRGNFVAKFDTGHKRVPNGTPATLIRR